MPFGPYLFNNCFPLFEPFFSDSFIDTGLMKMRKEVIVRHITLSLFVSLSFNLLKDIYDTTKSFVNGLMVMFTSSYQEGPHHISIAYHIISSRLRQPFKTVRGSCPMP